MFLTERKSTLKDNTKTIKARKFVEDVRKLADEYNLPFFVVTEGASATSNNNCSAIRNARDSHIEWVSREEFHQKKAALKDVKYNIKVLMEELKKLQKAPL